MVRPSYLRFAFGFRTLQHRCALGLVKLLQFGLLSVILTIANAWRLMRLVGLLTFELLICKVGALVRGIHAQGLLSPPLDLSQLKSLNQGLGGEKPAGDSGP